MVAQVFGDPTTNFILILLILLPAVQWVTGVARALANNTFSLELVDVFIRTDVLGRVIPLLVLIVTGRVVDVAAPDSFNVPGLDLSLLTGAGIASAVIYLVVVIKRILDNVNPSVPDSPVAPE